jgi:hypothetical protein
VLSLVVSGLLNKQIVAELGTSELTIKTHRGHVMQEMRAQSLADLVKMFERLQPADRKQQRSPTKAGWRLPLKQDGIRPGGRLR